MEIASGEQLATIVEVGGGLRAYSVAGRDVLDGYQPDEMCTAGRGQVLMPWPNRIRDGRYEFEGHAEQLPLSEASNQNAIHGLVRWVAWNVIEQAADRVVVGHVLYPQPGYPFALELTIEYRLSDGGMNVHTTARNTGPIPCPFGGGAHPYLTVGVAPVDEVTIQIPARVHLDADERGIPVGSSPVDGTPLDLRHAQSIGDRRLDDGYRDLERDAHGRAWAHLTGPDGSTRVSLWVDEAYGYLMVFTGDTLGPRARRSVAIEPMTCAPDAFNSGDGLIVLEPGETFSGSWGIRAELTA